MKIQLIAVCAIAIVLLAGCGKRTESVANNEGNNSTQTEATTASSAEDVVPVSSLVLVQDGKFNPQVLTVKKGTEVTWVNKDTEPCWVASDPHPIHNGYPGFDAGKGIIQDETYRFKFDKVGTFGYHDHLNITNTGKIIVEP